jgi:hypothetical protein
MNLLQKALIALGAIIIGLGSYLAWDNWLKPNLNDTPDAIVSDYRDLLDSAEALKVTAGVNCQDREGINKQIKLLEDQLSQLQKRRKYWLDNVPALPDIDPDNIIIEESPIHPNSEIPELTPNVPPLPDITPDNIIESPIRPGSEVPELTADVPPLPDIDFDNIEIIEAPIRPGLEAPELTPNVPPLPDVKIEVIGEPSEYIPEMPEINTGRPGSEVPELTSDVPPLPEIDSDSIEIIDSPGIPGSEIPELTSDVPPLPEISEDAIIDPNEYIFQMDDYEQKIQALLQELKDLCKEDPKVTSDKCSDACKRYKDCAAYTEDVTEADLIDAYDTCMEECVTWPQEKIKCINAITIKAPNDCVSFVNCQLPQHYEETYLP